MGAMGQLIIFFSVMVGLVLLGGLVLAYAGYSFLHVLISTSAGNDSISWPGDPFFDWMFKGWYLAWIAVLSILPAFLIVSIAHIRPIDPVWSLALASSACLLFPIFLLSSLSGSSRMLIVRGAILGGMARNVGLTLGFYLLASAVIMVCTAFVWYALIRGSFLLVPVAMITLATGFLVYARLLGRLGHAVAEEPASKKSAAGKRRAAETNRKLEDDWGVPDIPLANDGKPRPRPLKKKTPKKSQNAAVDPWAVPELEPIARPRKKSTAPYDPLGPEDGGYELGANPPSRAAAPTHNQYSPDDVGSYEVSSTELPQAIKPPPAPALAQVSSYEAALAAPRQRPKLPANPLLSGIFGFPFYPTTLGPLGTMSIGLIALGMMTRALLMLFPV
ncbi:hypothetical protein BH10PLA2_BH10PLA2_15290 [soil metagenome]